MEAQTERSRPPRTGPAETSTDPKVTTSENPQSGLFVCECQCSTDPVTPQERQVFDELGLRRHLRNLLRKCEPSRDSDTITEAVCLLLEERIEEMAV